MKLFKFLLVLILLNFVVIKPASAGPKEAKWTMTPTEHGAIFTFKRDFPIFDWTTKTYSYYFKNTYIEVNRDPKKSYMSFKISRSSEESDSQTISLNWKADGSFESGTIDWVTESVYGIKNIPEDSYINHSTAPNADPNLPRETYRNVKNMIVAIADKRTVSQADVAKFLLDSYSIARRNSQVLGYNIQWFNEMRHALESEASSNPLTCGGQFQP